MDALQSTRYNARVPVYDLQCTRYNARELRYSARFRTVQLLLEWT